jgi:hypothetical protein
VVFVSGSKNPKNKKDLSPHQKWKNLCDTLADDVLKDDAPEVSDTEIKELREKLSGAAVDSHIAQMEKRLAKETQRRKNKYRH